MDISIKMALLVVKALVTQFVFDSLSPYGLAHQAPPSMEFSRQEYWSGSHFLLQGIFLTQGLNPGILHCRWMLYHLSQK